MHLFPPPLRPSDPSVSKRLPLLFACQPVTVAASVTLFITLSSLLLRYSCLYGTLDCTSLRVCVASLSPPHALMYPSLSHTHEFLSLFTAYFAFEQGVRLSNGREEGTFFFPMS